MTVLWDGTQPHTEHTICTEPGSSPPPNPLSPQPGQLSWGKLTLPVHQAGKHPFPTNQFYPLSNLEFELSISVATTLTQASVNLSSHLDHHNNRLSGFLTSALVPQVYPQLTKYCDPIKTRVNLCPCVTYHPVSQLVGDIVHTSQWSP